jgi:heat shock protein HslJ
MTRAGPHSGREKGQIGPFGSNVNRTWQGRAICTGNDGTKALRVASYRRKQNGKSTEIKARRKQVKRTKLYAVAAALILILSSLIARSASGQERSAADAEIDLDGTSWTLDWVDGQDAVSSGDSRATLVFEEGRVRGNATCNGFSGSYERDGSTLSFGMLMSTMMACEGMTQETAYLAALELVAAYRVQDGQLFLANVAGEDVLVLSPMQHAPLVGTAWTLDSYRSGTGIVSVLQGMPITAVFDGEQVTGSAGCNRYFASAAVDGDRLSIGPAGSTEMFCSQEGTMAQEAAVLDALSSAVSFRIEGNALMLLNAQGERALVFTAVP